MNMIKLSNKKKDIAKDIYLIAKELDRTIVIRALLNTGHHHKRAQRKYDDLMAERYELFISNFTAVKMIDLRAVLDEEETA